MSEDIEEQTELAVTDPETLQLLGLFDTPAFARRGADMEYARRALLLRCERERAGMLDLVRIRLRQWSAVSAGPGDYDPPFASPIAPLWDLIGPTDPPRWAALRAPARRRRVIARDLVASVSRFNRRWSAFVEGLNLDPVNALIEQYNRYYLLEKECCLGSSRVASRHFAPASPLTHADLLAEFPRLPEPEIRG